MKGSKDTRLGVGPNLTPSQPPIKSTTSKGSIISHAAAGSQSQRKISHTRTSAHAYTKSLQEKPASTSVKSRKNEGGSISGHRQSVSHGKQVVVTTKESDGNQVLTNYTQYGLVAGQNRRADQESSETPQYQGGNQQQIGTSQTNLKSAKAVIKNIQMHQKTKSTQLSTSQGYAQMQAAAIEDLNIYANNAVNQTEVNSSNASKIAQKHSRHQSNPSWLVFQGSPHQQQQQHQAVVMAQTLDQQPNISVQIPKAQQVTVSLDTASVGKTRSKQINQSAAIVGGSAIQAHHTRFNSSRFGTQTNNSKIQKVQITSTTATNVQNNLTVNTTAEGASSTTNKTGGHKKSSSMANSKITQLLLKAGSKHYIQQALQQQNIQNPQLQRPQQPMIPLPQKRTILHEKSSEQDAALQWVSSYDVPRRSNDFMIDQSKQGAISSSGQQVYANINKSMDMAQQITAFNNQQISQSKKNKESWAEKQLQDILQIDQDGELSNKQELTYQEHLNQYLASKSSKIVNQPSSQITSADATLLKKSNKQTTEKSQIQYLVTQNREIPPILQQHALKTENKNNAIVIQQPNFFAQQPDNLNAQVNPPSISQQNGAASFCIEKIERQGKVISQNSIGIVVKKPSSSHVKNLSVNQKGLQVGNNQNAYKAGVQAQKLGQSVAHQRTKSDQVGNDYTLIINMGKVIQKQKGKVGEILKNNFIDAQLSRQTAPPGSVSITSVNQSTIAKGEMKQLRTYTQGDRSCGERSKTKNDINDLTAATTTLSQQKLVNNDQSQVSKSSGLNTRKPSSAGTVSSSIKAQVADASKKTAISYTKNSQKTIQQKYEELESKYNELLEQLENKNFDKSGKFIQQNQPGEMRISPVDNILQRQKEKTSQSSLVLKNGAGGVNYGNMQQPPQMNPRMIRYINNQHKMQQGELPNPRDQLLHEPLAVVGVCGTNGPLTSSDGLEAHGITIENRSADMHTFKQFSLVGMQEMKITSAFDDGVFIQAPNNSNRNNVPIAQISANQQKNQEIVDMKRRSHNRVNTHYYGQKIKEASEEGKNTSRERSMGDASNIQAAKVYGNDNKQIMRKSQPTSIQAKQETIQSIQTNKRTQLTGQAVQPSFIVTSSHYPVTASNVDMITISKTQQTPRTTSHSAENIEKISKHQREEDCALGSLARHTRMLWQNLVTVNNNNNNQVAKDTSLKQTVQQKIVTHRRSVSDGNDPNNFNFKQGVVSIIDSQKVDNKGKDETSADLGKLTLAHHSMQQKKRLQQQHQNQSTLKSTTRTQSRQKKQTDNIETISMQPDITSLESNDFHHHPNSQLIIAQQERKKTPAKKGVKQQPILSLPKESFTGKGKNLKKQQKVNAAECRSSSKGPVTTDSKLEIQKKVHTRLKSNSYKMSNKDSSLMVGPQASSHNDPSIEGSIQNPCTAILNGRFIEMAKEQAQQKVQVNRGSQEIPVVYDNKRLFVDISTKEQNPSSYIPANNDGSKRAFHHPALSQHSPWMGTVSKASQEMFIVQERTPSTHSDNSRKMYHLGNSRTDLIKQGLSPVLQQKNYKHPLNNLLKSQGPPPTAYQMQVPNFNVSMDQRKEQNSTHDEPNYIQKSGRWQNISLTKNDNTLDKKRTGIAINQAREHPICQAEASGQIGNFKNKLQNLSEGKRIQIIPAGSNHKRHKSDIVESQKQSYQPLILSELTPNPGQGQLPQKNDAKGNIYRRKEVKTAQISPLATKNVAAISDDFYAQQEVDGDEKLVNISIDELNEEEIERQDKVQRNKWVEAIRENSAPGQSLHHNIVNKSQLDQEQSDPQNKRQQQVNEKRKKFMQAHHQNQVKCEVLNQEFVSESTEKANLYQKKRSLNPQSVMLIEERVSTEESHQAGPNEPSLKYKNILNIAKRKFKSKSQVPSHVVKISQSTMEIHENDSKIDINEVTSLDLQKLQFEGIPADSFQENRRMISINMNIPCEIQERQEMLNAGYNAQTQRSLADSDQKYEIKPKMKKSGMKDDSSKAVFVPLNSMEVSNQNFRGVITSTPLKDRELKAVKKQNILIPEEKKGDGIFDNRIETYSSIEQDSTLTAKQKIIKKICKYIQLGFQSNGQVPVTTIDFYRIGKILGKGAFGKVNLALHNLTHQMVAIKSINKQYFGEDSQRRKVLQEVVILKQTRHKNIVRLFEYFETQKHILFVIEIAAGGDLLNYVRKRRQLKEDMAKSIFKQLIHGLMYCHSKGILHRDIKLDNILLSAHGEVKICDFGVSKIIRRGEIMTEQCGTPAYIAPEILKDQGYEGFGVDIWSSGVVLYAMLYGIVPFRANNMNELQKMIIKADYKLQDCISKEARDMLASLLEKDPVKRLTTRQILAHPWMADAQDTFEIFTQAEKNYIKSEYTYSDTSRYNRNLHTAGQEYESDAFVDAMLDTNENSILKNAETKSVILAPFNSTKSHIETSEVFLEQVRELLEDRRVIKFAPRVREIAKQYEVNNNAELDNGVQHDFLEEEAKAKAEAESAAALAPFSEIKMLDQLIKNEESLQMTDRQPQNDADSKMDPYSNNQNQNSARGLKITGQNNKKKPSIEIGEAENSLAPRSTSAMIQTQETLIADDHIIEILIEYGYPREAVVQYLNKNDLNSATTAYWLIQMAEKALAEEEIAQVAEDRPMSTSQTKQKFAIRAHSDEH